MLKVELDHIISEEDAAQKILDILKDVEENGETYAIMSNGHPVAAIVSADQIGGAAMAEAKEGPLSSIEPADEPEPALPEPALPEMPSLPPLGSMPEMPEPPVNPLPPMPQPPADPMPPMPPMPEPVAQMSMPTIPAMPSFSGSTPPAMPESSGSPMSEEPPEDISGPLIAQAPVTQTPSPNLPPLSGTENLQGFNVPNIPQS